MNLKSLLLGTIVSAATAAFAAQPVGVVVHECAPGKTYVSSTWNYKGEANQLFRQIQDDAQQAQYHANMLQSFENSRQMSWQAHVGELGPLKDEINDMSRKLCRLEVIRRATDPWQQAEIDRIDQTVRLMADNAADAILFGNAHHSTLWMMPYQRYTDNLYDQAKSLSHSVDHAVAYAKASKEYRALRKDLGMHASS